MFRCITAWRSRNDLHMITLLAGTNLRRFTVPSREMSALSADKGKAWESSMSHRARERAAVDVYAIMSCCGVLPVRFAAPLLRVLMRPRAIASNERRARTPRTSSSRITMVSLKGAWGGNAGAQ